MKKRKWRSIISAPKDREFLIWERHIGRTVVRFSSFDDARLEVSWNGDTYDRLRDLELSGALWRDLPREPETRP